MKDEGPRADGNERPAWAGGQPYLFLPLASRPRMRLSTRKVRPWGSFFLFSYLKERKKINEKKMWMRILFLPLILSSLPSCVIPTIRHPLTSSGSFSQLSFRIFFYSIHGNLINSLSPFIFGSRLAIARTLPSPYTLAR
ncbi:hypothetical protein IE53DRAFT_104122 [Violaceomyces palustris]|uniref:Uncharacterized protein n=1 Tax=Violaceomyces palustris TaxID=1673888 RepID=A0ACD0NWR1_9BASI|nr:hypothetical protein IE53DRAFT_104122 [Violaceomyces palustris]